MWIRSQKKKMLLKCNIVKAVKNEIQTVCNDSCYVLGRYESKERALEVLNQIQTSLDKNIYEMPEK